MARSLFDSFESHLCSLPQVHHAINGRYYPELADHLAFHVTEFEYLDDFGRRAEYLEAAGTLLMKVCVRACGVCVCACAYVRAGTSVRAHCEPRCVWKCTCVYAEAPFIVCTAAALVTALPCLTRVRTAQSFHGPARARLRRPGGPRKFTICCVRHSSVSCTPSMPGSFPTVPPVHTQAGWSPEAHNGAGCSPKGMLEVARVDYGRRVARRGPFLQGYKRMVEACEKVGRSGDSGASSQKTEACSLALLGDDPRQTCTWVGAPEGM